LILSLLSAAHFLGKNAHKDESKTGEDTEDDAAHDESLGAELTHGHPDIATWSTSTFGTLVLVLFVPGSIGSALLHVDHNIVSIGLRLDLSSISNDIEGLVATVSCGSLQVSLELVDVLLGHGVDGSELIPVHILGAWRSSNGTSIDPPVVGVNHVQKIGISSATNIPRITSFLWVEFAPCKTFEEFINDFLLGPCKFSSIIVHGEHDTYGCSYITIN